MPKIAFLIIASKNKPWKNILKYGPRATWYRDLNNLAKVFEVYSDGSSGSSVIDLKDPTKVILWPDSPSSLAISEPLDKSKNSLVFKTVSGLGALLPVTFSAISYLLKYEDFDFIVRTNVSSYWNVPMLSKDLARIKSKSTYAGVVGSAIDGSKVLKFASGAGIVISKDVALKLVNNYSKLDFNLIDDVAIGKLAKELEIELTALNRLDITSVLGLFKSKMQLANFYHFRLKSYFFYHGFRLRKDIILFKLLHGKVKKLRINH